MNSKKARTVIISLAMITTLFTSCKKEKDKDEPTSTEMELYNMAKSASGFTWYKNSSAFLSKSSGSGHSFPLLRTRYNANAASKLDANGKIIAGSVFAENSLIVKELNSDASTLERYAILYKKPGHADADENGWVWGYINADQSIASPSADKGSACKGCHSQSDNIDYMLMNKFFQ